MDSCSIWLWSTSEPNFWWKKVTLICKPHSSWNKKLWNKPANFLISKKIYTRFKCLKRTPIICIWLPPLSNLFLLCTRMNGSENKISLYVMPEFPLASEKKPELPERTTGVFSESINSKKLNNLSWPPRMNLGMNWKEWFKFLKNFIKLLTYLIEWWALSLAL